jgi:hypothetical protein
VGSRHVSPVPRSADPGALTHPVSSSPIEDDQEPASMSGQLAAADDRDFSCTVCERNLTALFGFERRRRRNHDKSSK